MTRPMTARERRSWLPELFCLARAALGVMYLGRAVADRDGNGSGRRDLSRGVCALLGLRHLGQALASVQPTRAVLVLGAEVDGAHCASMGAAALLPRPWRRAALLDGLLAGSMAAAGLTIASQEQTAGPDPGPGGSSLLVWRNRLAARAASSVVPGSLRPGR